MLVNIRIIFMQNGHTMYRYYVVAAIQRRFQTRIILHRYNTKISQPLEKLYEMKYAGWEMMLLKTCRDD